MRNIRVMVRRAPLLPQLGLCRLLAPAAQVLLSLVAVGTPSVIDPQGPHFLCDGTPNTILVGTDLEEKYRRKGNYSPIRTVILIAHQFPPMP
ncbi:hypothetical protein NDU88_004956 [Pleurodeles waltl]|uniref:Uncharacterized protein n=1 Tax=Pleurodeles waltl TaxID=8319 RepID=A0AAV7QJU4_PLEWA|nr:hypothetical protein NDU88_004956 [Pleurodeles waltl]